MLEGIRKTLSNLPGWSTKRHIVVFESDDWGSIRTRSKADFDAMVAAGLNVDNIYFTQYDCLESDADLERFFEVLSKHKDATDRPAVYTPMCVVANPNFEKIQENGFTEYVYEPMTETHKRYKGHDRAVALWREGAEKRLFVPALHAREHLNYVRWMENVRTNEGMRIAFDHQSMGASKYKGEKIPEYMGAFKPTTPNDLPLLQQVVADAGKLFEEAMGYKPNHFIAPNAEPMYGLDPAFAKIGVKYMTNAKLRRPDNGDGTSRREFVWLGKYYKDIDLLNITRNGGFEPTKPGRDKVDFCLADIAEAFKFHKPCIISSHRVNFIGGIDQKNADKGLECLDRLLAVIIKQWPDVEFMTSTELGDIIKKGRIK